MSLDTYRSANRANWDDRVSIHVRSEFYNVEEFKAGRSMLKPVEIEEMGDVRGKSLLHLQCHFGLDTLSWARRGATVTGIDFSRKAIEAAQRIVQESGIPGRFLESDLYDAPSVLDERFDIVYTGTGALCWLPDVRRWARVVAHFLEPGGTFYIREGHPEFWSLDYRDDSELRIVSPYFETAEPLRSDDPTTYTEGDARVKHAVTYEWNHGLGEVVTALIDAGLTIEFLHEHRFSDWKALPQMVQGEDGLWRLPEGSERVPIMYSIRAALASSSQSRDL